MKKVSGRWGAVLLLFAAVLSAGVFASCDTVEPAPVEIDGAKYSGPDMDQPMGAFAAPNGDVVAYGFSGFITDIPRGRTYPFLFRVGEGGQVKDTLVLRDGDYGQIESAVPVDDHVVAVVRSWEQQGGGAPLRLRLERIFHDGTRVVLCDRSADLGLQGTLVARPGGGYDYLIGGQKHLAKLDASCATEWLVDEGGQYVTRTESGTYVLAPYSADEELELTWVRPNGELLRRTVISPGYAMVVTDITAVGAGVAIVGVADPGGSEKEFVALANGDGEIEWVRTYRKGRIWRNQITSVPGAGLAFSYETYRKDADEIHSGIVRLDADGREMWRMPLGNGRESVWVRGLVAGRDGRLALAGYTAPNPIGGFGPRTDALVAWLDEL